MGGHRRQVHGPAQVHVVTTIRQGRHVQDPFRTRLDDPPTARPESKRPSNAQRPAPPRKPGKSIVNQKQRPWGLITAAVLVVVFAAVVVTYAVTRTSKQTSPYKQPALADATKISGVTYRVEPNHNHVQGAIKYDASPPVGGNHSQYWVDCTGTVYPNAIANENAVHGLEHGAVWITYRPGLPKAGCRRAGQVRFRARPDVHDSIPGSEVEHLTAVVGLSAVPRLADRPADSAVHQRVALQPEDHT